MDGHDSFSHASSMTLGIAMWVGWLIHRLTIGWITMKFCVDIHGPFRIRPTDFGDAVTFSLAPSGQNFNMANIGLSID